jgi:hypothetical protein
MKSLKVVLYSALVILGLAFLYGNSPIRPVREVFAFTTIDAPKQQVWRVLTNFNAYPQWNPFYTQIEGQCLSGSQIHVQVQLAEHTWNYAPEIKRVAPADELVWSEPLLVPGFFDSEQQFMLESTDSGQTRFVQHSRYSGALVPLLMGLYQAETEAGFRRMNDALKKRVEKEATGENEGTDTQL